MEQKQDILHGTTTVALVCRDGVVLAADKRATAGNLIVPGKIEKVFPVSDNLVITTAGSVSDAQLLTKLLKAELKLKELRTNREPSVKEAANLLAGMVYGNIRRMSMVPGISHFLLGGKDETGYYVYDIFPDGSCTFIEEFVASGSGSVMVYGVLETLYDKKMSVEDGVQLAVKSINASLQRDNASGNGITIVTITPKGVKKVVDYDMETKLKL